MEQYMNQITLIGNPGSGPVYSHSNHGRDFYTFPLEVRRLSGTVDRLPILVARELLEQTEITEGDALCVTGQIRSHNNRKPGGRRLIVSVLAESLELTELPHDNRVCLQGSLCKEPVYRRTPLGREICDVMLAVSRSYGRADYLPCILWGNHARLAASYPVGTALLLTGRLQSREYIKLTEGGSESRTTYEISVITAEVQEEEV